MRSACLVKRVAFSSLSLKMRTSNSESIAQPYLFFSLMVTNSSAAEG